jgi:hypothetical protein
MPFHMACPTAPIVWPSNTGNHFQRQAGSEIRSSGYARIIDVPPQHE